MWQAAASSPAVIFICTRTDWLWIVWMWTKESEPPDCQILHFLTRLIFLLCPSIRNRKVTSAIFKEAYDVQVGEKGARYNFTDSWRISSPKSQNYLHCLWHFCIYPNIIIMPRPQNQQFYWRHIFLMTYVIKITFTSTVRERQHFFRGRHS